MEWQSIHDHVHKHTFICTEICIKWWHNANGIKYTLMLNLTSYIIVVKALFEGIENILSEDLLPSYIGRVFFLNSHRRNNIRIIEVPHSQTWVYFWTSLHTAQTNWILCGGSVADAELIIGCCALFFAIYLTTDECQNYRTKLMSSIAPS